MSSDSPSSGDASPSPESREKIADSSGSARAVVHGRGSGSPVCPVLNSSVLFRMAPGLRRARIRARWWQWTPSLATPPRWMGRRSRLVAPRRGAGFVLPVRRCCTRVGLHPVLLVMPGKCLVSASVDHRLKVCHSDPGATPAESYSDEVSPCDSPPECPRRYADPRACLLDGQQSVSCLLMRLVHARPPIIRCHPDCVTCILGRARLKTLSNGRRS